MSLIFVVKHKLEIQQNLGFFDFYAKDTLWKTFQGETFLQVIGCWLKLRQKESSLWIWWKRSLNIEKFQCLYMISRSWNLVRTIKNLNQVSDSFILGGELSTFIVKLSLVTLCKAFKLVVCENSEFEYRYKSKLLSFLGTSDYHNSNPRKRCNGFQWNTPLQVFCCKLKPWWMESCLQKPRNIAFESRDESELKALFLPFSHYQNSDATVFINFSPSNPLLQVNSFQFRSRYKRSNLCL